MLLLINLAREFLLNSASNEEGRTCVSVFFFCYNEAMQYIKIGKIVTTHGIRGEVKIQSYSDFDTERYRKGACVYICSEGNYIPFVVHSYRVHKWYPLVAFEENLDINKIEQYKNCDVFIDKSERKPLTDGRYYVQDLLGLTVKDEEGNIIGTVLDVEETLGAQKNLRIRTEKKEVLVPYVPAFVKEVNLESEIIVIHVVEGLL